MCIKTRITERFTIKGMFFGIFVIYIICRCLLLIIWYLVKCNVNKRDNLWLIKLFGSDMLRSGEWSSTLVIISIFGSLFLFDGNSFKVGDPGRFNDLSTFGHFLVVVCFGSGKQQIC